MDNLLIALGCVVITFLIVFVVWHKYSILLKTEKNLYETLKEEKDEAEKRIEALKLELAQKESELKQTSANIGTVRSEVKQIIANERDNYRKNIEALKDENGRQAQKIKDLQDELESQQWGQETAIETGKALQKAESRIQILEKMLKKAGVALPEQ